MTKIIFFGTEDFSVPTLTSLIDAGYDIVAAVTKPDSQRGRGHKLEQPAIKKVTLEHNIAVLQPEKVTAILPEVERLKPEIGILVSYGKIIPQSVIDAFPKGIINIHPSLLPKYRGPSPMESAILNGDKKTGISIMSLSRAMDAGPIYKQKEIELAGSETKTDLYRDFSTLGANMLLDVLPHILDGSLQPKDQIDAEASYCNMLSKEDGRLDPETMTAIQCERRIRAFIGWPKTRLRFLGNDVIITSAKVLDGFDGDAWPDIIRCKNDSTLQITELISPNGKQMKTADYIRGLHTI